MLEATLLGESILKISLGSEAMTQLKIQSPQRVAFMTLRKQTCSHRITILIPIVAKEELVPRNRREP